MTRHTRTVVTFECDACGATQELDNESDTDIYKRASTGWLGGRIQLPIGYNLVTHPEMTGEWCSLFCFIKWLREKYPQEVNKYPVKTPELGALNPLVDEKTNEEVTDG